MTYTYTSSLFLFVLISLKFFNSSSAVGLSRAPSSASFHPAPPMYQLVPYATPLPFPPVYSPRSLPEIRQLVYIGENVLTVPIEVEGTESRVIIYWMNERHRYIKTLIIIFFLYCI